MVSRLKLLRPWLELRLRGFRARGPQGAAFDRGNTLSATLGSPRKRSFLQLLLRDFPPPRFAFLKAAWLGSRLIVVLKLLAVHHLLVEDIIFAVHFLDVMVQSLYGPRKDRRHLYSLLQ